MTREMKPTVSYSIIYGVWGSLASVVVGYLAGAIFGAVFLLPSLYYWNNQNWSTLFTVGPKVVWLVGAVSGTLFATWRGYRRGLIASQVDYIKVRRQVAVAIVTAVVGTVALGYFMVASTVDRPASYCAKDQDCSYAENLGCLNVRYYGSPIMARLCTSGSVGCSSVCTCVTNRCQTVPVR